MADFKFPLFYNYPTYFTLQPVKDTREKQVQLLEELILDFCKTQGIFVIRLKEGFPLFSNPTIERSLTHEARQVFLSAFVSEGRAEWLDKGHRRCLVLWHHIKDWADILVQFVKENGLEDSVVTVEEIRSGPESRGTGVSLQSSRGLLRMMKALNSPFEPLMRIPEKRSSSDSLCCLL